MHGTTTVRTCTRKVQYNGQSRDVSANNFLRYPILGLKAVLQEFFVTMTEQHSETQSDTAAVSITSQEVRTACVNQ